MFYLVLPANFKEKDSDAEVYTMTREGSRVSYRSLSDLGASAPLNKEGNLDSIREGEEDMGDAGADSIGVGKIYANDADENATVSSTGSKRFFGKTFKRAPTGDQEVVYMFRVLLDGNEKFIWLQAAAELGRLSNESAARLVSTTVDVTK